MISAMTSEPGADVPLTQLIGPAFYDLHHDIKTNRHNEYWLKGGRGSLKSTFVSIEILLGMIKDPKANAVIFRLYQNELRDSVYGQIEWSINKMQMGHLFKCQVSPMQIKYLPTGQKILFRGADQPMKTKSVNIGKGYVKYLWFEEVDQYSGPEELRTITQSYFRGGDEDRITFLSYNPPRSGRSWVNAEVRIPKPGRRVHHSSYLDAPAEWLGRRFIADAEHLRETNENAHRHEYLGEEVGTGLEVFTNVTLESLANMAATFDQIRQGLDFGYAVDPLCFERMHYDRTRRRLYFIDEISGINMFNREFAKKATDKGYHRELTIADSAEPKSISELKNDFNLKIKRAKKGPGSIEYGIKFLQDMEQIIIDPIKCPMAAKEYINYSLDMDRSGIVKSRFPDKDNHSIDAARYGCEDDMSIKAKPFVSAIKRGKRGKQ